MTASESTTTPITGTITAIQEEESDDTESFSLPSSSSTSISTSITINNAHDVDENEKDHTTHILPHPSINLLSTVTADSSPVGSISEKPIVSTIVNHLQSPVPLISKGSENIRLASLLERFVELSKMDGRFYLCDHQDMIVISNWLHSIPLTLAERFTFANAPVSLRDTLSTNVLYQFAATYALRRPVALNIRLSRHKPR